LVPLIGEPLPLDFVNTRPQIDRGVADLFDTLDGLDQWLSAESDRLPHVRVTARTRAAVVELRQHAGVALDELVLGGRPPEAAIACLNAAVRRAPSYPQLRWNTGGAHLDTLRHGADVAQLLAALAEAAVEYLASDIATKTQQCEAPDCELLFSPTHPRRRWCSPTVCGNRTRVARYYERHKD
jgi:predicted RNA-binding Zn ribbon-like protein